MGLFDWAARRGTRKKIAALEERRSQLLDALERHGPHWTDRAAALKVVDNLNADIALMTPFLTPSRRTSETGV